MKRFIIIMSTLMLFFGCSTMMYNKTPMPLEQIDEIYSQAELEAILDYDVFKMAMTGFSKIAPKKDNLLSIIDFGLPSTDQRFYLIDIKNRNLLYYTYTSHGVNTGEDLAVKFSNKEGSRQSSLGFYLTAETYEGKHGVSLKLDGLERGFNHHARKRYIVIHSADYVTDEFIQENGRLGRSWGCPALPPDLTQDIIEKIKEGSVLFIYGNDENYLSKSKLIK
jgi:L,D-transpeptidase catalytic domain